MSMTNACDACGWLAAVGGMLAFGTFGVPIKSKVAKSVDIDPLVMQTYKTSMCFLTSWIILLCGEKFSFTPWGIVSAGFWVPGGVATIYAVKNAGLAIGIGVGSSFIVLVSFTWGIFVFDEHVHSRFGACVAVGCMMVGLLGMAYFSSPAAAAAAANTPYSEVRPGEEEEESDLALTIENGDGDVNDGKYTDAGSNNHDDGLTNGNGSTSKGLTSVPSSDDEDEEILDGFQDEPMGAAESVNDDEEGTESPTSNTGGGGGTSSGSAIAGTGGAANTAAAAAETYVISCCGMKWEKRTLGILAAMFTGTYGGSVLVPMKWAPDDDKGLGFLISFGIGAALVTLSLWIFRYIYLVQIHCSMVKAYYALPSFHFRKMWLYGGTCGLLWSIGNFFSILSVEFLGEGVGYSLTQASILVSGLWGIFYFHEIQGTTTISNWLGSASITVFGILLLSYEHHEK